MLWHSWKVLIFLSNTWVFKWEPLIRSDSVYPILSPPFSMCDCLSEQWLTADCINESCRLLSVVTIHQSGLWWMIFVQVLRHVPYIHSHECVVLGALQDCVSQMLLSGSFHSASKVDLKRPNMRHVFILCHRLFIVVPTAIIHLYYFTPNMCVTLARLPSQ